MRRAAVALALLLLGGCKNVRETDNRDAAFLHDPTELEKTLPAPTEPLFPVQRGTRWNMEIHGHLTGTEEDTLTRLQPMGKHTGLVLSMRYRGQIFREEIYTVENDGVSLLAVGVKDQLILDPPLPLVKPPYQLGRIDIWQGNLRTGTVMAPGRGWSRLNRVAKITVPAGTYEAWEVDTVLETNVEGKATQFPMTRWFVPGVGIVKSRVAIYTNEGVKAYTKELTRFQPSTGKSR